MSTILKALRRLEEEREAEAGDLRDQVLARPRVEARRPRLPLLVGAGAIGALLVVGGVWLLRDPPSDSAPSAARASLPAPSAAPRASLPATPRASLPEDPGALVPAAPRPASAAPTREIAVRPPAFREAPLPAPSVRREAAPARVTPVPARATSVPATAPPPAETKPAARVVAAVAPTPVAPAPVAAPAAVASAPVSQPALALPPVAADAEPAPRDLPGIVGQPEVVRRAPMPRIVVERTLWHPTPGRRLAVLHVEGRAKSVELREGDALGDAVVQQIDPSAVVFLHRGVEVRRRVGAGG